MSTIFHYPEYLSGEELDDYLARGWFRMQQAIFTCRYLFQEGMLSTAVWLRLPLPTYKFSKSLRKLMRKNYAEFEVVVGPAIIDTEKELLFARYKDNFKGMLSDSLYHSLGLGRENIIYSSMQTEVRKEGKLVAFSIFDCGDEAIQSVSGIYDPDFSKHSLGLFTMLLEVEYAKDHQYEYFYPGYIAPGRPVFEYKLRTKGCEFFDPETNAWFPIEQLEREELPSSQMDLALNFLMDELAELHVDFEKYIYPPHQVIASNPRRAHFFSAPIFLDCFYFYPLKERVLVEYEPKTEKYRVGRYFPFRDLEDRFFSEKTGLNKQFFLLMRVLDDVYETYDATEAAEYIASLC